MNPKEFFDSWKNQMQRMILEKAQKLVTEKLGFQKMREMQDKLSEYAKSIGCERIFSYVDKDGKPLSFYKREGFKIIGTVGEYCEKYCLENIDGDDFEDKEDFVIMKEI